MDLRDPKLTPKQIEEDKWVDEPYWNDSRELYVPYKNSPLTSIDDILNKIELELPEILRNNYNRKK